MNVAADRPDFLPARRVWERYGVTDMTIDRWVKNPDLAFPKPVYIGRYRYWRISDLEAWERSRAKVPA